MPGVTQRYLVNRLVRRRKRGHDNEDAYAAIAKEFGAGFARALRDEIEAHWQIVKLKRDIESRRPR
jgi:hypothetical protein